MESYKKIEMCLADYHAIQKKHLSMFEAQRPEPIKEIQAERAAAFLKLKQLVVLNLPTEKGELSNKQNRFPTDRAKTLFTQITKLDENIKNEINNLKRKLSAQMNQMRRGKEALSGYKNANCTTQIKPQVLSMNR